MKLLQKRVIDSQKIDERKREIQEGVKLAESIDRLRQAKLNEEKSLKQWREANLKAVQTEIDRQIEIKGTLEKENNDARILREELLKPLNEEWKEVNKVKSDITQEKESIFIQSEQLKSDQQKIQDEWEKVSQTVIRTKNNEQVSEKAKLEIISLKEMANAEYQMARSEHITATDLHERKLSELDQREKEYKVALSVIAIRENEVKEKESELLVREQDLERQQRTFQIAREVINKNDSTTNTKR